MGEVFSGTNQGRFTSTGAAATIQLPSGVDFMWVYNTTQQYAAGAGQGVQFYWQLGMPQGQGTQYTKTATTNALAISQIAANSGFYFVNSTVNLPGPSLSLTGITSGTPPVVNTVNTSSLINGGIVRIFNTVGAQQLGGLDFSINNISAGSSFDLAYMQPIVSANPGAGTFRVIPYNPYFYPPIRYITNISQAQQAIVTLSVDHAFTVGQSVRFIIPTVTATAYGMTQLNGIEAAIVAIDQADVNGFTNTITVNVNTSGFSPFVFPLTTAPGFTPAQVVPVGEWTSVALQYGQNILGDATNNIGYFGLLLQAGVNSPAGSDADVIYWVAGKSFSVNNM